MVKGAQGSGLCLLQHKERQGGHRHYSSPSKALSLRQQTQAGPCDVMSTTVHGDRTGGSTSARVMRLFTTFDVHRITVKTTGTGEDVR